MNSIGVSSSKVENFIKLEEFLLAASYDGLDNRGVKYKLYKILGTGSSDGKEQILKG